MKAHHMKIHATPLLLMTLLSALCGCDTPTAKKGPPTDPPVRTSGYTYSCWLHGWRKNKTDQSPEFLAIQTSAYDLTLNLADFAKAGFAFTPKKLVSYVDELKSGTDSLYQLPPAEVVVTISVEGEQYRAVSCVAGTDPDVRRLGAARMWESGRFVQHFEFVDLKFQEPSGKTLGCRGTLAVVAWPDSLTLTAALAPDASNAEGWRDAQVKLQLKGQKLDCQAERAYTGKWRASTTNALTLTYNAPGRSVSENALAIQVSSGTNNVFPVAFEATKNCYVASAQKIKRTFKAGYTDIRDYDDFAITVDNADTVAKEVPFLLDFRSPANITGLCPILCDKEGRPTGVAVQLSKNWHYAPMGAYLMAYTSLPAKPGRTEYLLRVAYGFYGALPSASHAQLSLIGYSGKGGNGRWDQLAIGCWGETFCLDMDMSLVDIAITDVRLLMARNGLKGTQWSWTDAGWGGDWLGMTNGAGAKLAFRDLKTAYLAQGPCLTDVRYAGFYGADREVALKAQVQTMRTDDYARTLNTLSYTFRNPSPCDGVWLFKMGRTGDYVTPQIAYGNQAGLLSEQSVPANLKPGARFIDRVTLSGAGPWWVAFPGARHTNGRDWGTGSRALVIRSYQATIGGRAFTNPTISLPVHNVQKEGGGLDLDLLLVAPKEVTEFIPGDTVAFEAEWMTLPRIADDYYGPNEEFRKHLAEHPASWRTVYREAIGNDLRVTARGGKVMHRYPLVIHAEAPVIDVGIKGGVGFVPLRVEGLEAVKDVAVFEIVDGKEIRLDQAVYGNDFWQTDYDEGTRTYSLTYNLPLDGKAASTWRIKTGIFAQEG
jgi:hypothetical protein